MDSSPPNPLLYSLDEDPLRAEEIYLDLSHRLRRYFEWNRFQNADDLSQEALTRGLQRLSQGTSIYSEDKSSFFFGIARNLRLEQRKKIGRASCRERE